MGCRAIKEEDVWHYEILTRNTSHLSLRDSSTEERASENPKNSADSFIPISMKYSKISCSFFLTCLPLLEGSSLAPEGRNTNVPSDKLVGHVKCLPVLGLEKAQKLQSFDSAHPRQHNSSGTSHVTSEWPLHQPRLHLPLVGQIRLRWKCYSRC
jgi:hypothetical protein